MTDGKEKYLDFPAFLGGSDVKIASVRAVLDGDDDNQLVHTSSSTKS